MAGRRRVCARCGSTRFRLVAAQLVCATGHIQRDFRVETATEDDGFGTKVTTRARHLNRANQREAAQADRRRRQLHARRVVHGRTSLVIPGSTEHAALEEPDTAYLYGPRATFAIVQCLQLVLRHEVRAMVRMYPALSQLEHAAREIWALHISSACLPAVPLDAARRAHRNPPGPPRAVLRSGRERYVDVTQRVHLDTVSLRSVPAVLFLALVVCRAPLTLGDVRQCLYDRSVPYLGAVRFLPPALLDSLSFSDMEYGGLNTEHVPSVMELHRRVGEIATRIHLDAGLVLPEVNALPILARMVQRLLLPAPIYVGAKSLLSFLRIDMHVRNVSAKLPRRGRSQGSDTSDTEPEREPSSASYARNASVPRCVMLMAAVVVLLKLQWGLDGKERSDAPATLGTAEAYAGTPPFSAWLSAVRQSLGLETSADAVPPPPFCPWDTTSDMLAWSDADVDTYMDFLEDAYTLPHVPRAMAHARRDTIPDLLAFGKEAPRRPFDAAPLAKEQEARMAYLHQALYPPAVQEPGGLAPGEAYPVYAHDPSGKLPPSFVHVLDVANRVLGVDTAPPPQYHLSDTRHRRDQDILLDTVMQLDEALLATLRRRRHAKGTT